MLSLKPVDAMSSTWKFGVSDHTLVALAAALLDDEPDDSVTPLAEAMALDPAFTIWAATAIARREASFGTIRTLAGQVAPLLGRLLSGVFSCAEASENHLSVSQDSLHALVRAEVARFLLASEPPPPCDDPVYFAAILASTPRITGCTPEDATFLAIALTEAEKMAVEASARLLEGHRLPTLKKISNLDERLLGVDELLGTGWIEQRRRHLEQAIPEAEPLLKKLLARLDRVRQIETSFHETLEHEKLEAMAEFAAGAGHEINNPIAVIAGRAQLMLQDEEDPERARSLALINAQAKRVYEMIADMRLFARPPEPTFEEIDLISLIDELLDEMAETADAQSTTLRRTGPRRSIVLQADPTQLTILLRVMIQNSLEALGSGGTIGLEAEEKEDGVTLHITDDGPGITDEVRRHLFDPYYSGRQAGRGLGLGLSKAWRIVVTNHGGTIEVDSQSGEGTTFTIYLPKPSVKAP